MFTENSINEIAITRHTRPEGSRFSIKSGLLLTLPKPNEAEIKDVFCDNCPLYEYREDTVNKVEGHDRRTLIRCAGQRTKEMSLGPINIADHTKLSDVQRLFRFEDATPCGIYYQTLRKILMSPGINPLPNDGIKFGDI
jgi:hypothetical protein